MAGGRGCNSHISILKKGISLKNVQKISDLPNLKEPNGIFTISNKCFLNFFGLDQLVVLEAAVNEDR